MLSFYSVPANKPWGHPENMKGTMGKAPEVQGPAALHSYWTGWTTEAFCLACREHLDTTRVLRIPPNNSAHRFYMFSFPDARNAHNRLRWIGKTQKMAGTSGNSFNGSYRVQHCQKLTQEERPAIKIEFLETTMQIPSPPSPDQKINIEVLLCYFQLSFSCWFFLRGGLSNVDSPPLPRLRK